MKRRGRAQEGLRKKRATKCAAGDVSLPAGIARLYTSSLGVGRAQPGKAGVTSWPSTGTKKYFHPQPTRSCPPDPPKACCQTLVVGMWKCSPPQSQHFNSVFFPLEREEGRMRRVTIELTTSGLWDLRATNCAIAAMTFEGSQQDQACPAAPTKDAHAGAVADVLQDSPWWVLPVLGFSILFHLCFAKTLHHR